jgi:hypothetical protein
VGLTDLFSGPSAAEFMFDAHLVKDSGNHEVDEV